jgi:hypothetical protein
MTCTIIAALVTCSAMAGPKTTPDEALRIFLRTAMPYPVTVADVGPQGIWTGSPPPTLEPWDPLTSDHSLRIDGAPLSEPPPVYGGFRMPYGFGAASERRARRHEGGAAAATAQVPRRAGR